MSTQVITKLGTPTYGTPESNRLVTQVEIQEERSGVRAVKQLAPVLDNSVVWGSFVALSSNTRYQIVAGIEERILVSSRHEPQALLLDL